MSFTFTLSNSFRYLEFASDYRIFDVNQPFSTQSRVIPTLKKKPFWNIVGKGENAVNQQNKSMDLRDKITVTVTLYQTIPN